MYQRLTQEESPTAAVQGSLPGFASVPSSAARHPHRAAATPAVEPLTSSPLSTHILGAPMHVGSDPRLGYHRDSGDINTPPAFASTPYLSALTTGEYELRDIPDFVAEAVSDFNGNPIDSTALSLRRGERVVVTMVDRSGRWVLVRTVDGREGEVPMSSLRRIEGASGFPLTSSSSPPAAPHGTTRNVPMMQEPMSSLRQVGGANGSSLAYPSAPPPAASRGAPGGMPTMQVPYPAAQPPAASDNTPWDMATMQANILDLMSRVDNYERGLAGHDVRLTKAEKRSRLRNRGLQLMGSDARSLQTQKSEQKQGPEEKIEWMNVALPPDIFSARFFLDTHSENAKWFLLLAWISVLLEFAVAVIVSVYMATAETGSMDMVAFGSKMAAATVSSLLLAKDVRENVSFAMVLVSGHDGDSVRVTLNDYILFPFRIIAVGLVLVANLWNIVRASDALEVWKDITAMTFVLSFPKQIWDAVIYGVFGESMHEDALHIRDLDFLIKVEASSRAAGYYRLFHRFLPLITLAGMLAGVAYVLIKKCEDILGF